MKIPIRDIELESWWVPERPPQIDVLADHIRAHGQLSPVLLDGNGLLLDGRRRLQALNLIGEAMVDIQYCLSLEEACQYITTANGRAPETQVKAGAERAWRAYVDFVDLSSERASRTRSSPDTYRADKRSNRKIISDAFGLPNESVFSAYIMVLRAAANNEDPSKTVLYEDIKKKLVDGDLSVYQARNMASEIQNGKLVSSPSIMGPEAQREAMGVILSQFSAVVKGIGHLGPLDDGLNSAELEMYAQAFGDMRKKLSQFITALGRKAK